MANTKRLVDKTNIFFKQLGIVDNEPVDFRQKSEAITFYIWQTLCRTQSMFEYKNLPDTIPQKYLENYLQTQGVTAIATNPKDNKQYALMGGLGGECDGYYIPKYFIGANPWLEWTYELERDKECIVVFNDTYRIGILPIIKRYASLLAENELTIKIALINSRLTNIFSAPTDNQKKAAEEFISQIDGGELAVIRDNSFSPMGFTPYGSSSQRYVTQLIEMEQYLKSQLFNDLGLNANYNMKRETITSTEVTMNSDSLLPFCEDMLRMRKEAIEKCNDMFGWNASVDFSSSWKNRADSNEYQLELEKNQAQQPLTVSKESEEKSEDSRERKEDKDET